MPLTKQGHLVETHLPGSCGLQEKTARNLPSEGGRKSPPWLPPVATHVHPLESVGTILTLVSPWLGASSMQPGLRIQCKHGIKSYMAQRPKEPPKTAVHGEGHNQVQCPRRSFIPTWREFQKGFLQAWSWRQGSFKADMEGWAVQTEGPGRAQVQSWETPWGIKSLCSSRVTSHQIRSKVLFILNLAPIFSVSHLGT